VVVVVDSVLVSVLRSAGVVAPVKVVVVSVSVLVSVLGAGVAATDLGFLVNVLGFCPMAAASGAGDEGGATTSVFCSHALRSAAPARMQISFFIV
jgi:hypothetical protein